MNKILITTIGGVASPGKPILELTPLGDELRIQAQILPRDVAFVYLNMDATIKLSAYDYTVYGSFTVKVTHLSAGTFEKPNRRDTTPYYKVFITLDPASINATKTAVDTRPGMLAVVALHADRQSVLRYGLKPLFKMPEAMREP